MQTNIRKFLKEIVLFSRVPLTDKSPRFAPPGLVLNCGVVRCMVRLQFSDGHWQLIAKISHFSVILRYSPFSILIFQIIAEVQELLRS